MTRNSLASLVLFWMVFQSDWNIKVILSQTCTSGQCQSCPLNGCTVGTICSSLTDCTSNLCVSNVCSLCSNGCTNGDSCTTQNDCLHNVCELGLCARCTLNGCQPGNVCTTSSDCVKTYIKCKNYFKFA